MGFEANISSKLDEDSRLVVRVSYSLTAPAKCHRGDVGRLKVCTLRLPSLTDVVVLTVLAGPAASGRGD